MKKKPHLSSRQPPTDDQILRRMKRSGVPPLPEPAWLDRGAPCWRTAVEPDPSYPKGCLPQIDAQMAREKVVDDAWDYYMKSCTGLGLDVMTLLRREPEADVIKLASEVIRRAGLARDAYDAFIGKVNDQRDWYALARRKAKRGEG